MLVLFQTFFGANLGGIHHTGRSTVLRQLLDRRKHQHIMRNKRTSKSNKTTDNEIIITQPNYQDSSTRVWTCIRVQFCST